MVVTQWVFAHRVAFLVAKALKWSDPWEQYRLSDAVLLAVRVEAANTNRRLVLTVEE